MFVEKIRGAQVGWETVGAVTSSALIMVMMLLTTVDVILRYVFNRPLPETVTLCEFLMVGIVYLGIAYVQRRKGHVRVDLFIERIHGRSRIGLELAILILALGTFVMLAWASSVSFWKAAISWELAPGLINYPLAPVKLLIPIGVGMLCLRLITDIFDNFAQWRQCSPVKPGERQYCWIILPGLVLLAPIFIPGVMEPMTIGWVFLGMMLVLLILGMPVAFAILVLGFVGFYILGGGLPAFTVLSSVMYTKVAFYTLTVLPLFILMGHFAFHGGFARDVYEMGGKWLARIPGGLAQATVIGGAALGAACGSGIASAATLTKVCIPSMRAVGVDKKLAVGAVASIGPIATMIPPSLPMVAYGVITEQSIAKLLIAGIFPGITFAIVMMIIIFIMCKLNPSLAPLPRERISWKERLISLKGTWGILAVAFIVIGGIYTGVFTPTEAGALGAFGALVLGIAVRRLKWANLKEALMETSRTTGMILLIIAAAFVYMHFLAISRIPSNVSEFLAALEVPRIYVFIGFVIFYTFCGCFLDMLAVYFLTLPVLFPAMVALGYDPIWFGVIVILMGELSMITPPFGLTLFVVKGLVPDAAMNDIIVGASPFVIAYYVTLVILTAFPQIALFLPSLM